MTPSQLLEFANGTAPRRLLGTGHYGKTYASELGKNHNFAIKVVEISDDSVSLKAVKREVEVYTKASRNILRAYGYLHDEPKGIFYYSMALYPMNLRVLIENHRPKGVSDAEFITIFGDMVTGVLRNIIIQKQFTFLL